jgi:hypothetical protein
MLTDQVSRYEELTVSEYLIAVRVVEAHLKAYSYRIGGSIPGDRQGEF